MFNWWFHGRQVECGYAHCALLPYVGHFHDMLQLCKNWRDLEEKEKSGQTKSDRKHNRFGPQEVVCWKGSPGPIFSGKPRWRWCIPGFLGQKSIFESLVSRKSWFTSPWKIYKGPPKGSLIVFQASFVQRSLLFNFRCVNKNRVPTAIKKGTSLVGLVGWCSMLAHHDQDDITCYIFNYVWLNLDV